MGYDYDECFVCFISGRGNNPVETDEEEGAYHICMNCIETHSRSERLRGRTVSNGIEYHIRHCGASIESDRPCNCCGVRALIVLPCTLCPNHRYGAAAPLAAPTRPAPVVCSMSGERPV